MDQIGFTLPVMPGKSEDARAFFQELERSRKQEYSASERRIGVTKELWFLQQTPQGDVLVAYIESPDAAKALQHFAQSQDAFDQWFKRGLAAVTGVDLNNPPPWPLSEQVSNYE
ncbi:MAG TPA: DUF6176 family protein [Nitrolancea sp.]|nr:DUF6176 family protein [Nitrolancea sp.]